MKRNGLIWGISFLVAVPLAAMILSLSLIEMEVVMFDFDLKGSLIGGLLGTGIFNLLLYLWWFMKKKNSETRDSKRLYANILVYMGISFCVTFLVLFAANEYLYWDSAAIVGFNALADCIAVFFAYKLGRPF